MAVMNPCCCCKLQLGVTIVAIINIFFSTLYLILQLFAVLLLLGISVASLSSRDSNASDDSQISDAGLAGIGIFLVIFTIIVLIAALISVVASVFLFIGARKRNMYKCRIWFAVSCVFALLYVISKLTTILKGLFGEPPRQRELQVNVGLEFIQLIFYLGIVGYQLWVVYAFMEELKEERERGGGILPLAGGAFHYAPKNNPGENPPPYGQAGYTPYAPTWVAEKQAMYPPLPGDDNPPAPYNTTTASY